MSGSDAHLDLKTGEIVGMDPTIDLLFLNLLYVFWFLGIWFSIRIVHKRKLRTLVTGAAHIQWKQIFSGFGLFFALLLMLQFIYFLIFPEHYIWNEFDGSKFLFLFIVVLFLTPIQTTVEELIFRGFLLQWIAKLSRNPVILSIIMAIIFGSLHFANPEMERSAIWVGLDYVFVGFMLTLIAVKVGSSELSIGAHAANNMFLFWFLADPDSVGGSVPALFTVAGNNPAVSFFMDVVLFIVFYLLVTKKFKPSANEFV